MPLLSNDLAQKLWESLSTSGGKPVSAQITAYATGIIAALKAGTLSNLPGTVNGTTAIGGAPMTLGMAMGGTLSLQADAMIAITTVGMDPAAIPNIKNENKAIIAYIGLSALVNFSVGGIVGNSTATPLSPGPLTAGAGSGGTIA